MTEPIHAYSAILPAWVRVGFPARSAGGADCSCAGRVYTVLVSAADAGVDTDATRVQSGLIRRVSTTAPAYIGESVDGPSSVCGEPSNYDDLVALAKAIATAYYGWRIRHRDIAFAGTIPWEYEGTTDLVTYSLRHPDAGGAETRVSSAPLNVEREDLFHAFEGSCSLPAGGNDWIFAKAPVAGIPSNVVTAGGIQPRPALCEVWEEDATGELKATGRSETIWNYWSSSVPADRLVRAVPRRTPRGCRMAVVNADCTS